MSDFTTEQLEWLSRVLEIDVTGMIAQRDWAVFRARLEPEVLAVLSRDQGDVSRVRATWAAATESADNGDPAAALRIGKGIEKLLNGGGSDAPEPGRDRGSEDSPSPAEAKWLLASRQMQPHVEDALSRGTGQPDKIRAVWAFAHGKAEQNDFAAALKSLGPLATLIKDARASTTTPVSEATKDVDVAQTRLEVLAAQWASESRALGARVAEVLKTNPGERSRIEATWAAANERAEAAAKGQSEADYASAFKMLETLRSLLDTATPETMAPQGGVAKARTALGETQKLAAARQLLQANTTAAEAALQLLRNEFKPALPPIIENQAKTVEKQLAPDGETDPLKVEAAAIALAEAVTKLEESAVKPRAERAGWENDLSLFQVRLLTLENHPLHDEAALVKPKLDAIRNGLAAAKLKAAGTEWAEASKALALLLPACDAAEEAADALAEFRAIRMDRVKRLIELPRESTISAVQPRQAVADARKLLADADDEKDAGKLPEAIALLNRVPAAVDRAADLVAKQTKYDAEYAIYQGLVVQLEAFTGDAAAAIATGLADFRNRVAAADVARTNDYAVSVAALSQSYGLYLSLLAKAQQLKDYKDALNAFDPRLTEVKDHPGRIAIEDFFARMQADKQYATDRAAEGQYAIAAKTLDASEPLHTGKIALADKAKDYKGKLKDARAEIAGLEKPVAANAASLTAEAKRSIAAAETAATGKDWDGALKVVDRADDLIQAAQRLLDNDKDVADLKDTAKLDDIANDFDAAFDVYQAIYNRVDQEDTNSSFGARLAQAEVAAQSAKSEAQKPKPNFGKARSHLGQAIATCEQTMRLISKEDAYTPARDGLQDKHDNDLPAVNQDNVIDAEINEASQAITRAEALAQADVFDFDGALREIGNAMVNVRTAELKAAAYAAMKPDLQTIDDAIAFLKDPARAVGVAAEIKRLEDAKAAIDSDRSANKYPDAAVKAAAAAKLCPALRDVGANYEAALAYRKQWVLDTLPLIQGDPACKPEYDIAKQKNDEIQVLFDRHLYKAAYTLSNETFWIIAAGKTILAEAQLYEPARSTAETKLTTALANRNPATEERYDALRDRYDAAAELAASRSFTRARDMLSSIPAECDNLLPDAQAYIAYEAARKKAGEKLGEAVKSKQAAAIRPLLEHLQSRHAAAIKLAGAGDYARARALFEALFTDAEAAVTAAGEAANFAAVIDSLRKPGAGSDDLAKAVQDTRKLYEELRAKPEALYAIKTMPEAGTALTEAEALLGKDDRKAREALEKAVDFCAQARIAIGHYAQMEAEMQALTAEISGFLSSHPQADFVRTDAEKLLTDIEAARRTARGSGDHAQATRQIEASDTAFVTLRHTADDHGKYVTRRGEVEPDLTKMEKHANRYAISDEIELVRTDLVNAAGKETAREHEAAMDLLEHAADTSVEALLKAKMHGNQAMEATDIASLKKILASPNGSKRLDAIVKSLDPQAQRKVLVAAFEARFGCKLDIYATKAAEDSGSKDIAPNKRAPDIRRFYDLMSGLPDTHTKDNDSMQVFVHVGEAKGSDYTGSTRKVAMREGDVNKSGNYGVALPHEIDEVEPGCETLPGEPITYFSWNTVHEVGHAVDDKLGFMQKRGKELAGWTDYGGNVRPVAQAVAGKYQFDADYVGAYISGTANPAIPEPDGCDGDEWERRRVACHTWVDSARSTNDPWQSAASAKLLEIDGVCYQESYPNYWTSYPIAERKRGVTGYQFRAPGEWFSELYAAYHTGRLKQSHPAVAWLSTL